jgi:hypothetical protein
MCRSIPATAGAGLRSLSQLCLIGRYGRSLYVPALEWGSASDELLCFLLAGCSSVESFPENLPPAPYLSTVLSELKKVAAEEHLAEPVEVSDAIRMRYFVAFAS